MEYQIEEQTPVKRKVTIQVPAEEVDAALAATTAMYRKDLQMAGFRKGKVPSSIVEGKYRKEVTREATNDLLNVHIHQVLGEMGVQPLAKIDVDAGELSKGEEFTYSFSFEVVPDFDLPEYHGLQAEQEKVEVSEADVQEVIERIRGNLADVVLVKDDREPVNKDVVVVDFQAYDNGEPLEGVKAENFELTLGEGQALEDFEALVKQQKPGSTGKGQVTFPEDFINSELAGKSVDMEVTLKAIKERRLPDIDDELAVKAGGFENLAQLREAIENSYRQSRMEVVKSVAQKKLLDHLGEQVDIPLPESLVEDQIDRMVADLKEKMERRGRSLESLGKTGEELRGEHRPQAESLVTSHLLLLAVAKKEELSVSEAEVDQYLYQMAVRSGQDYKSLKEYHEQNNLMYALRDKLLADKAMNLIYDSASITEVEARDLRASAASSSQPAKPTEAA